MKNELTQRLMSQAQVFASAWSLVGGRFDSGHAITDAEEAKEDLESMVQAAIAGHEHLLNAKCAEIERLKSHLIDAQALIQKMMTKEAALQKRITLIEVCNNTVMALHRDSARLDWVLTFTTGDDTPMADARTMALARKIMAGLEGRAAVDAAMAVQP